MYKTAALVLFLGAILASAALAEPIASVDRIRDGELVSAGFELKKGAEVDIEAVGLRQPQSRKMAVYAWIIDHDTRDLVWSMTIGNTDRADRSSYLRKVEKSKFFEAGRYELYMHSIDQYHYGRVVEGIKDFYDIIEDLVKDDENYDEWDDREWDEFRGDCFVRVSSDELSSSDIAQFAVTGERKDALVQFVELGDDEYISQGFKLDQPMNIRIYALVEHPRGNKTAADYGWIVNNATQERVWEIDRWNTERAGGGRKNRKFDDEVRFDAGSYTLHFVTDDSHSYERFNMEPPWDPISWGVTLLPGTDYQASAFHLFDATVDRGKPLIDFTGARDNDYHERAFELKKASNLGLYAIGEYSDGRDTFVDHGWIEDAATGDVVWEMTYRNTAHAGGAEKNRMFDGSVKLEPGRYVAFYVTDDSHSYRDWNDGRPYDDKAYGLAIYPGEGFDNDNLVVLKDGDLFEGTSVLAQIVRVRDHERRRERFTLDKDTQVRIHALGEGMDRRMYDYGWIEDDATGKVVWEMTWRKTEGAGGADKNREVTDVIDLPEGTYVVQYESDGSHSFGDWNDTPPRHPRDWGITVTLADGVAKK
jgi:hypothetical protein